MSFITQDLDTIVKRLQAGDIAAIPTETVYGLAADCRKDPAIKKVFATKGRPSQHPLILHVLAEWDLNQWVEHIPKEAMQLIKDYWPGPLTLVFPTTSEKVSPLVTGGQATVAIRAPRHPLTQALLQQLNHPIVAPSANPFEKISPTTAAHVLKHFPDIDLAILDGGRCKLGMESTIIDMAFHPGKVLRQGSLELIDINHSNKQAPLVRAPGQHLRHYQPTKPFFYFESITELPLKLDAFYILTFTEFNNLQAHYQFVGNREDIFYEFYYQIQVASESDYPMILIEMPKKDSRISPIIDRIKRAAQSLSLLS
jgi:L-threonylcarbamoyladenylate synthase